MKGIILAGGKGSRLYPITKYINKHLLPIYNKPMIYYGISTLMLAGIRDIALVVNKADLSKFSELLGNGSNWGIKISYIVQKKSLGIVDGLLCCEKFISKDDFVLLLGDNIFFGSNLINDLSEAKKELANFQGIFFSYKVSDPKEYGVLTKLKKSQKIIEKPKIPESDLAVTGLYFYKNNVIKIAKTIKLSKRGEKEITDLNNFYLKKNKAKVLYLKRGYIWFDAGSIISFNEISNLIKTMELRQNLGFGYPEEIALNLGYIEKKKFYELLSKMNSYDYSKYLKDISK